VVLFYFEGYSLKEAAGFLDIPEGTLKRRLHDGRKRLRKYGERLFTFLDHDGVPWNNNNAEHAVKKFAKFRKLSDGLFTERTVSEACVLLTVLETCDFNNINKLDFILSGQHCIRSILK